MKSFGKTKPYTPSCGLYMQSMANPQQYTSQGEGDPTVVWSLAGTVQGCTLGSYLFALGVDRLFRYALGFNALPFEGYQPTPGEIPQADAAYIGRKACGAIIDDIAAVFHRRWAIPFYLRLERAGAAFGLTLNRGKCHIMSCSPSPPGPPENPTFPRLRPIAEQAGVNLNEDSIEVGKLPVIRPDGEGVAVAKLQTRVFRNCTRLFNFLRQGTLSLQIRYNMLRLCALPLIGYEIRAFPPHMTSHICTWFDRNIMDLAKTFLGCTPDISNVMDDQQMRVFEYQIRMPVRRAGFGLRSQSLVAHTSYLASSALVAYNLAHFQDTANYPAESWMHRGIVDSMAYLWDHGAPMGRGPIPVGADGFLPYFAMLNGTHRERFLLVDKLQSRLTKAIEAHNFTNTIRPELTPLDRARWNSASGATASLWLTTPPREQQTTFSDNQWISATRLRGGTPLHSQGPLLCVHPYCNGRNLSARSPTHPLTCPVVAGLRTLRHDDVNNTGPLTMCKELGLAVIREEMPWMDSSNEEDSNQDRYDGLATGDGRTLFWDVSITHPLAVSHIRSAQTHLGTAANTEREKNRHWDPIARQMGVTYGPIVFETLGSMGRRTANTFRNLVRMGIGGPAGLTPKQAFQIKAETMERISFAIQRGNAFCIQNWLARVVGSRRNRRNRDPWRDAVNPRPTRLTRRSRRRNRGRRTSLTSPRSSSTSRRTRSTVIDNGRDRPNPTRRTRSSSTPRTRQQASTSPQSGQGQQRRSDDNDHANQATPTRSRQQPQDTTGAHSNPLPTLNPNSNSGRDHEQSSGRPSTNEDTPTSYRFQQSLMEHLELQEGTNDTNPDTTTTSNSTPTPQGNGDLSSGGLPSSGDNHISQPTGSDQQTNGSNSQAEGSTNSARGRRDGTDVWPLTHGFILRRRTFSWCYMPIIWDALELIQPPERVPDWCHSSLWLHFVQRTWEDFIQEVRQDFWNRGYTDRESINHLVARNNRDQPRPYLADHIQERLLAPRSVLIREGATDPGESNLGEVLWARVIAFARCMWDMAEEARDTGRMNHEISLEAPGSLQD